MEVVVGGGGGEGVKTSPWECLNSEEQQNPKYLPRLPTHLVSSGRRAGRASLKEGVALSAYAGGQL